MKKVKIFVKEECPRCPAAKELGARLTAAGRPVNYYDVDTAAGLAEASFFGVMATPTIVIVDEDEEVAAVWRSEVPSPAAVTEALDS